VTGYQVFRNGVLIGTSATNSYNDTGLTGATVYQYTVKAYDAAANYSAASAGYNVNTLSSDTTPPTTPTNFAASNITSTGVTLSWTASTDNIGVANYEVHRDGNEQAMTPNTSYTVSGLLPSTTYQFTVLAMDAAANESAEATVSVTTAAATAKPTVSGTSVVSVTSTTATVTSQINPNGAATTANFAYGLTSSLGNGTANQSLGSGTTPVTMNATITGLTPNTTYYFRAQASNSVGGVYPAPITFTTAP
jgi:chitodextrinase